MQGDFVEESPTMTRILRILLAATALVAASFNIAHAQSATVTFNDPNCGSWGLTQQSATAFTLTCQSLTCNITAVPAAPLPTDSVTLTASCGASASAVYAWSQTPTVGGCPATSSTASTASLTAPGATILGCSYKVSVTDGASGGGSATKTLNWTSAPPPTPTGCSVTFSQGSASLPNAGGPVTMNGNCTGNVDANTVYAWTKNGAPFTSGKQASDALSAGGTAGSTTTYQFQATNPGGTTVNTQQLVTVAGSGGGGGFDLSGCTAAGYTGRGLDVPFPVSNTTSIANGAFNASPGGTFGNSDALVLRFTTPAAGVNDGTILAPAANPPAQNTPRVYTLSTKPCDFATSGTPTGSIIYATAGSSPSITINNKSCPYNPAICGVYGAWTQPNTTYFLTMVNRTSFTSGLGSCAYASCDMRIDFTP
jgi:hypothetical protein